MKWAPLQQAEERCETCKQAHQINANWTGIQTDNTFPGGRIILDSTTEPLDSAHYPAKTGIYATESAPNKLNAVTIL